jgi:hypothetical protein
MNAEEFADFKFQVDCLEIVLFKKSNGTQIKGPGEVWQDETGGLKYKIFTDETGCFTYQNWTDNIKFGELYKDEDYLSIRIIPLTGGVWNADRLTIETAKLGANLGCVISGTMSEIQSDQPFFSSSNNYHITLRFKGHLNYPCNQSSEIKTLIAGAERSLSSNFNVAIFDDEDWRFELSHNNSHTALRVKIPKGCLVDSTPSRLHESLQFVLGKQVALMSIETWMGDLHTVKLRAPRKGAGSVVPPIYFNTHVNGKYVWDVFIKYLNFVQKNEALGWHPISCYVAAVLESEAASLEAHVLSLSVAVEGLVKTCFSDILEKDELISAELSKVESCVKVLEIRDSTIKRIIGSIKSLNSVRNSDLIKKFIENHTLDERLFRSWKKLRNTSAHGGNDDVGDIQSLLRKKDDVLSLFYLVILSAIEYSGLRTDHSCPAEPWRLVPMPQQLSAAQEIAAGKHPH